MRLIVLLFTLILPAAAFAQMRDSVFADYESYSKFVDEKIMSRDFKPLINALGGGDEYSAEQMEEVITKLKTAFPQDFTNSTIFRQVDLGGDFRQEARAYWVGDNYAFYYAALHQRGDELVVITFNLNNSFAAIMSKF
ncbi:MAG TPA: hypothetical protein ENJ91_00415 [Rhodobacteraceae bacterium]|nr:hypothetical protein [Paracoccaceae bacterium]